MKISNAFIVGVLNLMMAELQMMQNEVGWAIMFGLMGAVILIADLFKEYKDE